MKPASVSVLDGSTFAVSDAQGDIQADTEDVLGLFWNDMRHLSRWQLRLNGRPLQALSTDAVGYDEAVFFLVVPTGTIYRNPRLSVLRRRWVCDGLREQVTISNHTAEPVLLELSLLFDPDFADIFEVKDHLSKQGSLSSRVEPGGVVLGYRRGDFRRETHIRVWEGWCTAESITFQLRLAPQGTWHTEIEVAMGSGGRRRPTKPRRQPNIDRSLEDWLKDAPALECDWDDLRHIYHRSLVDLAALRFYPAAMPGSLPAAGLPWFMALFGRDSLIASYQALPFIPELARTTLRALAARQASERDDFRDAEPGKILHELRFGELTHFGERPQSPYYGSADSTLLWLILLDEYERWTGDHDTIQALERPARAALHWLEDSGDLDGDGYIEYQRRNTTSGLENQCWKDSWNSIVHPDGRLASLPRATCELQGYAYDARRRCARLARVCWDDPALAERLEQQAGALAERFDRDFWVTDGRFFALALDGRKAQVRTLTSNMGQLLWSGIVADHRIDDVVDHLMQPALFSGWGIRTLAKGQDAYNPIEYHNGTVWPHDSALIAAGLARYRRHEQAGRLAQAALEAAKVFDYRLPEVFAGYDRQTTGFPVPYPTACSPQAWATGAPLLLLRVLLGLEPDGDQLRTDPHVPGAIGHIALRGIPGRWGRADAATRDR